MSELRPSQKMPTLFISHGGGPWPYIPEMKMQFARTAEWLTHLPSKLPEKPQAIISISGHWEQEQFSISSAEKPPMIFDYSGFPDYTYQIKYEASGSPKLAEKIQNLLIQKNINCDLDSHHGFDHGTFVPLVMMYPQAEIPVVSLSLKSNYSPLEHYQLGEALQSLRQQGVLIMGSGLSYHNMRGFGRQGSDLVSKKFGDWLQQTVTEKDFNKRKQLILDWEKAPAAREAHPQEDHLLPLMVVMGAADQELGRIDFVDHVFGVDMASAIFG